MSSVTRPNGLTSMYIAGQAERIDNMDNGMTTKTKHAHYERFILVMLMLLAFGVRLAIARMDHVLQRDEGAYLWLGKTLVTGGGYQFFGKPELHYTPFYPLVSGLVWLLVRDLEIASKVCFVLFGALTLVPVYLLARRMYGWQSGCVAAALVAVAPALTSHVYFWGSMTEPLYFFLVFSGIYLSVLALEGNRWWTYPAAGALFSLAYLTRPEALAYIALTAGYALLVRLTCSKGQAWRPICETFLMALAFIVLALPYLVFLYNHLGRWSLSGKTWIAFVGHRALVEGDLVAFDRLVWGLDSTGLEVLYHSMDKFKYSLLDEIVHEPAQFVRDVLRNLRQMDGVLLSKRVLPFFLLPLLGLGLFRSQWSLQRRREEIYLVLMAVLPAIAMTVFTTELRFYLGSLILLLLWIGHGVVEFGIWVAETASVGIKEWRLAERVNMGWQAGTVIACTLALVAYFVAVQPAVVRDGLADKRFHYKAVGQWLAEHSRPDEIVMSRGAITAIYADRQWVPFPYANYDEMLAYARAHGVNYVVVHKQEFELMRPHLAFLADPTQLPSELQFLYRHEGQQGTTVVLRLVGQEGNSKP